MVSVMTFGDPVTIFEKHVESNADGSADARNRFCQPGSMRSRVKIL